MISAGTRRRSLERAAGSLFLALDHARARTECVHRERRAVPERRTSLRELDLDHTGTTIPSRKIGGTFDIDERADPVRRVFSRGEAIVRGRK